MKKFSYTCELDINKFNHDHLLCIHLCEYAHWVRGKKYSKGLKGREGEEEEIGMSTYCTYSVYCGQTDSHLLLVYHWS